MATDDDGDDDGDDDDDDDGDDDDDDEYKKEGVRGHDGDRGGLQGCLCSLQLSHPVQNGRGGLCLPIVFCQTNSECSIIDQKYWTSFDQSLIHPVHHICVNVSSFVGYLVAFLDH